MWNFDPKKNVFLHTLKHHERLKYGGLKVHPYGQPGRKIHICFFRLPYELNKKSARQLLLPTAYQSVDISREFHKVVQTRARPLTPPLWEANQTERGKTGSAIFSITQPKISQMLPETKSKKISERTAWTAKENLKKAKAKLFQMLSIYFRPLFQNQYQHLFYTILSIYDTTSSSPYPSSFYEARVTHWVTRVANYKTQAW